MVLAFLALALADTDTPSAMDIQDCASSVEALYPPDGGSDVALDAVPTVLVGSPDCGGVSLSLVLLADGEVVAERSVDTNDHLVELEAELRPGTEYQFLAYESGRDVASGEAWFTTGARLESAAPSGPAILSGEAVMSDEGGEVYLSATVSAVPSATVIGLAPWDGIAEVGDPTDVADAAEDRYLRVSMSGPQVGEEACVAAMSRGLDGTWSAATTECFIVTQGWSDEEMRLLDDHDAACNAASAAMGLAPILLGTLGILRRRAR